MSISEVESKKPFSSLEKDLLLNIIQKYDDILTCKKTNASSVIKKKQCWEQITTEFNASDIVTQKTSTKQLTKLWYNMKAKAREAKTKQNVRYMTGGGPSVPDMDPVDVKVMDIDKNILTNIEVDIDSDVNEEELLYKQRIHEEEIQMKIVEREYKQKILEVELQIAKNNLHNSNKKREE